MKISSWSVFLVVSLQILVWANSTNAATYNRMSERFFLGVILPYNSIRGDYRGDKFLLGYDDIVFLPHIRSNIGIGLNIGGSNYRDWNAWMFEISFVRSMHNAMQMIPYDVRWAYNYDYDYQDKAILSVLDLNFRLIILPYKMMQPNIITGLCYQNLRIRKSWLHQNPFEWRPKTYIRDAIFSDLGFNLGIGLIVQINSKVFIRFDILHRGVVFNNVDSEEGFSLSTEDVASRGWNVCLTLSGIFYTKKY